jgi:CheY-like chemotaxis protein
MEKRIKITNFLLNLNTAAVTGQWTFLAFLLSLNHGNIRASNMPPGAQSMTILLVDDEPSYRMLVRLSLEAENWTVLEAGNGQEALDILHDETIDLIISDVYMPVMDGIKFHKNVRAMAKYQNAPFIFVSGFDDNYTMGAIQNVRIEGFARKAKPVSFLKEWIRYLTTPESKRAAAPPSEEGKIKLDRYTRGERGRGNAKTPTL